MSSLAEPVNLYFFFSEEASRSTPALRAYAQRVRELLEEMAERSGGKLRLTVIDPQPFSEDEDRAADFGLAAVPVGAEREPLYFGLAGTNSTDGRETIGFFQPDKEEFLEYDVASLVYRLANPKKPVVGLLSTLAGRRLVRPDDGGRCARAGRPSSRRVRCSTCARSPGRDGDRRRASACCCSCIRRSCRRRRCTRSTSS